MRNGRTCDDQVVSCVTTPPRAAEHAKAIRTHAGGKLRALRAASLRSGPLACLRRRGGHSLTRERASCSNRAAHQPAETTSIARARSGAIATRRERPRPRLGNRGSLPSNAAAHVACWRCVPVVPGRCGMCAVPAAHLARRMLQQLPRRARELSPRVAAAGCLSLYERDRAACGVTEGGLPPLGAPRTPSGTSPARASPRSGEAAALRVWVCALPTRQPAAPPY